IETWLEFRRVLFRSDLPEHVPHLVGGHVLGIDERVDLAAPGTRLGVRIELVGAPRDPYAVGAVEILERRRQAGGADVAPGAGDVGPHFEVDEAVEVFRSSGGAGLRRGHTRGNGCAAPAVPGSGVPNRCAVMLTDCSRTNGNVSRRSDPVTGPA